MFGGVVFLFFFPFFFSICLVLFCFVLFLFLFRLSFRVIFVSFRVSFVSFRLVSFCRFALVWFGLVWFGFFFHCVFRTVSVPFYYLFRFVLFHFFSLQGFGNYGRMLGGDRRSRVQPGGVHGQDQDQPHPHSYARKGSQQGGEVRRHARGATKRSSRTRMVYTPSPHT